ncbi:MAG: HNH endonuclease [Thermaerobacter sp.]|nr:HNH endonuclease [Thermaerobacter sp.]
MKTFVGITDHDWYTFLSQRQPDEVNFWTPSSSTGFRALTPGEPFLFKLHAPRNFIVGGGFFTKYSVLPLSMAWLAFGDKNGAASRAECQARVQHYRHGTASLDPEIGCIILERPFFFAEPDWIPAPPDWSPNIVRGKGYELSEAVGRDLWEQVEQRLEALPVPVGAQQAEYGERGYWGIGFRRVGQGAFRVAVTDAYGRQCAVTKEHTLPVLEAAHIKPFADGGPHDVANGLLLRADLHILFDRGYVTVDEGYRFVVSPRLKDDYHNGRDYYARHGHRIVVPSSATEQPSQEHLEWHRSQVFIA